jgi:menaquinol-cytochrome c reductase iron-sulfur subunit
MDAKNDAGTRIKRKKQTMKEDLLQESEITRRTFLNRIIIGIGVLMTGAFVGIGTIYFSSPLWKKKEESWIDLGPAKNFKTGEPAKVDFTIRTRDAWTTIEKRSSAWIVTANQVNFIAYDPKCTHLGCPYHWSGEKQQFVCPCHAALFAMDGTVISGPAPRSLDRYATKVVGGHLYLLPQQT